MLLLLPLSLLRLFPRSFLGLALCLCAPPAQVPESPDGGERDPEPASVDPPVVVLFRRTRRGSLLSPVRLAFPTFIPCLARRLLCYLGFFFFGTYPTVIGGPECGFDFVGVALQYREAGFSIFRKSSVQGNGWAKRTRVTHINKKR